MATTGNERGEKRNDGISKQTQYSEANPGPEQNCWSWKEDCSGKTSRGEVGRAGPGPWRVNTKEQKKGGQREAGRPTLVPSAAEGHLLQALALGGGVRASVWPRWGLGLTLQAVPIGAGAGGRRGGLGSDDWCKSTLLFHG